MKIFHLLTVILVLLKVLGVVAISWWLALAPSLIVLGLTFLTIFIVTAIAVIAEMGGK